MIINKKSIKNQSWSLEEKQELYRLCNSFCEWHFYFPGYSWVAMILNDKFKNSRTAADCSEMDKKLFSYPEEKMHI
jgi:hypothetical protein